MVVLESMQNAGMVDSWQEYLCLERLPGDAVRLSVCGHELVGVLDEIGPADEETGERDLPEKTDGKPVQLDGDFLVYSDRLVPADDEAEFPLAPDEVRAWLKKRASDRHPGIAAFLEHLTKPGLARCGRHGPAPCS